MKTGDIALTFLTCLLHHAVSVPHDCRCVIHFDALAHLHPPSQASHSGSQAQVLARYAQLQSDVFALTYSVTLKWAVVPYRSL